MKELSGLKGGTTAYVEEQYIGLATMPLRSSGILVYAPPGHLEKTMQTPAEQSIVIDGGKLTLRQGKRRPRTVALDDHPEIGALIASIRSTLNGDLARLRELYDAGLSGSETAWKLTLTPIGDKLRKFVTSIGIEGNGASLRSVEIAHSDGDRSVMTMLPEGQ